MLGRPTIIEHGGDALNDWLYNKDVARGIVLVMFAEKLGTEYII